LAIDLHLDLSGYDALTGQLGDGTWTAQALAFRPGYSKGNPAPQVGQYTVLLPGGRDGATPPGAHSFGVIKVDDQGQCDLTLTLADGLTTKLTPTATLTRTRNKSPSSRRCIWWGRHRRLADLCQRT